MPIDPYAPPPTDPDARAADRLAALERRLARVENAAMLVTAGAGAPAATVNSRFYVDYTNNRLYVRTSGGVYRYATLT